jgi:hypothetical protein
MKLDIAEISRNVKMLVGLVAGLSPFDVYCSPLLFNFLSLCFSHPLSLSLSSLSLVPLKICDRFVLIFVLVLALTCAHSLLCWYLSWPWLPH